MMNFDEKINLNLDEYGEGVNMNLNYNTMPPSTTMHRTLSN